MTAIAPRLAIRGFLHLLAGAVVVAAGLSAPTGAATAQAGKPEHIRGTVTAADAASITVSTREGGTVRIALPGDVRISGLKAAALSQIAKGSYIGTAAVPVADGRLRAQEVLIFPERMRGVGEGHRPWDLTPDSTMTNAAVDLAVDRVEGRELVLVHKDGTQRVVVPPGTPVVTIVPADRGMLEPGTHIFALAVKEADGGYRAIRVSIGIDGLVPPM